MLLKYTKVMKLADRDLAKNLLTAVDHFIQLNNGRSMTWVYFRDFELGDLIVHRSQSRSALILACRTAGNISD